MRAAAVRAVRLGFRAAFSVAMVPVMPLTLVMGLPSTLATGRAMSGPSTNRAMNSSSTPGASSSGAPANRPRRISADADGRQDCCR